MIDSVLVLGTLVILWIALTGGSVVTLGRWHITARSVDNPLVFVGVLALLRYSMRGVAPFLGLAALPLADLEAVARRRLGAISGWIDRCPPRRAARAVAIAMGLAFAVKGLFALLSPGFFSGDDVEVHEMSVGLLLRAPWPVWDLRSAFYPIGFIYPAQVLAHAAGIRSIWALVTVGRLVVAALSSLAIGLLWVIGKRKWASSPGWAACAAVLFAANALHMSFGSSELPRPVSTLFVLVAYLLLAGTASTWRACLAGMSIGVAASFRFSEVVFVVPAVVHLAVKRRHIGAVTCIAATCVTAVAILGIADRLYWGEAFHSAAAAVDYTLVRRLSSRGYQNAVWYVLHVADWVNPAVLLGAIVVTARRPGVEAAWAWLPLIILSCLPHKEARYVIPLVPFVYLLAVDGLRQLAQSRRAHVPVAVAALLILGLAHDVGHWRLPRTDDDVRLAWQMNDAIPAGDEIAVEQAWRLGSHLYLRQAFVALDPGDPRGLDALPRLPAWVLIDPRGRYYGTMQAQLAARGYVRQTIASPSTYVLWRAQGS